MSALRHKLPIHLEQPDTLLFGLSARQTLLVGVGMGMGYATWTTLATSLPGLVGLVVAAFAGCLVAAALIATAFIKIKGRGLEVWTVVWLLYLGDPKIYLHQPAIIATYDLTPDTNEQAASNEGSIEEW